MRGSRKAFKWRRIIFFLCFQSAMRQVKKIRIHETLNLSTDADSSSGPILKQFFFINIYFFWGGGGLEFPILSVTKFLSYRVTKFLSFQVSKWEWGREGDQWEAWEFIMWSQGQWEASQKTAPNGANRQTNMATFSLNWPNWADSVKIR